MEPMGFGKALLGLTVGIMVVSSFLGLPMSPPSTPLVTKVEPPNWWTPSALGSLLLLCYGQNLQNACAFSSSLKVRACRASADGHYLLVWVNVPASTSSRPHHLVIRTLGGETTLPFTFKPLPSAKGKWQGLTTNDVIYLIMPDRFCDGDLKNNSGAYDRRNPRAYHGGDLEGIRQKLPYLKALGVTALWLTPLYDNSDAEFYGYFSYHGYLPIDFFTVDEHLGTMEEYQGLVREAHRLGLKIVQDHILNHTGLDHPWVQHPPTPSCFHPKVSASYKMSFLLYPQAPQRMKRAVTDGWFFGILPDLNQDDPIVAQYLIQHSLWWLAETGADAIRLDTTLYLPRPFLQRWRKAVRQQFPKVTVIGEVLPWPPDPRLQAFFQGGRKGYDGVDTGLESVFDFALARAVREVFGRDAPMRHLKEVLDLDSLYPAPHRLVMLLGNHDFPRFMTFAKPFRRWERLKLATLFLVTTRGSVQWYYGDEIGMEGGSDPDNRRDFPGGFPDDPRNAFAPQGRTPEENDLWETVQSLFRLRRRFPWLAQGRICWWHISDDRCVYERIHGHCRLFVVINKSDIPFRWMLPQRGTAVEKVFGTGTIRRRRDGLEVTVPKWQGVVFLQKAVSRRR